MKTKTSKKSIRPQSVLEKTEVDGVFKDQFNNLLIMTKTGAKKIGYIKKNNF